MAQRREHKTEIELEELIAKGDYIIKDTTKIHSPPPRKKIPGDQLILSTSAIHVAFV